MRVCGVAWIIPLLGGVRGGSLGREISLNIKQITEIPTPKFPPKRGISTLNQAALCIWSLFHTIEFKTILRF